jgi:hypothetical protein
MILRRPRFVHLLGRDPAEMLEEYRRKKEDGALVFSCGALHRVTPVTKGRRYAFLALLYGEEDAIKREANNARLHVGEAPYASGRTGYSPTTSRLPTSPRSLNGNVLSPLPAFAGENRRLIRSPRRREPEARGTR